MTFRPAAEKHRNQYFYFMNSSSFGLGIFVWKIQSIHYWGFKYGFEGRAQLLWWEVNGWIRWGRIHE